MSIDYCHSHHRFIDTDKWSGRPECESSPLGIHEVPFEDIPYLSVEGAAVAMVSGKARVAIWQDDWDVESILLDAWDGFAKKWTTRKPPRALASQIVDKLLHDDGFCGCADEKHRETLLERV